MTVERQKKIGIFDSGLGGLYIARAIRAAMPDYDYVYLGDTMNMPYGGRSFDTIYTLTESAIRFLFDVHQCDLVVIACNTASVMALRKLQQEFLVRHYPDRRILGVIVPTLEVAITKDSENIGLFATEYTVRSKIYDQEIKKIKPQLQICAVPTPLLVPLIEHGGQKYLNQVLSDYLGHFKGKQIQSLILGCTHYVAIKDNLRQMVEKDVHIIAQDEIIPAKLQDYLKRHPEMEGRLSKNKKFDIFATDMNENFLKNVSDLMKGEFQARFVDYPIQSNS